jgi:CheY-like chemotaxis protein
MAAELFRLVRRVADAVSREPLSDAAIGRIVGLEGARTSRWRHGHLSMDDAARLLALSSEFGIDMSILCQVAAGYLSADDAWHILSDSRDFVRFLSEQMQLCADEQAMTIVDQDGSEARIVRHSATRYTRRFRKTGAGKPPSQRDQERMVLLADDDGITVETFANMTGRGTGVTGIVAGSLEQALLLCGIHRPHRVILDLFLSGGDGFNALRVLSASPDVAADIVATSAVLTPDIIRRAKGCGAASVIERPLRARLLGKLIREA